MGYSIDLQEIADKLDFDLEDVEMLIEVFLEGTEESLSSLKSAIDENNLEEIYKSAHAIKGSAANLTLMEISDIAKEIELSSRQEQECDYMEKFKILQKLIEDIQS